MKKVVPNGSAVKALREQLEQLSTQKEMANEIGVAGCGDQGGAVR